MSAKGIAAVAQLVTVPLCWRWMGKDQYSLYLVAFSLTWMSGLIDVGISLGTDRQMAQSVGQKRWDWARQVLWTGLASYSVLGAAFWLLMWGVGVRIDALFPDYLQGRHDLVCWAALAWWLMKLSSVCVQATAAFLRFERASQFNILGTLCGTVTTLALAYRTHDPSSLVIGQVCNFAVVLIVAFACLPKPLRGVPVRPRPRMAGEFLLFGVRGHLQRILDGVGSYSDRLLLGSIGIRSFLADYAAGTSVPTNASLIVNSLSDAARLEMIQAKDRSMEDFRETFYRSSTSIFYAAIVLILLPCAFGGPFMRAWLGDKDFIGSAMLTFGFGVYRTFDCYYMTISTAFMASGRPERGIPFYGCNSLLTVLLTLPMARAFGFAGLVALNIGIQLLVFVPLTWYVGRSTLRDGRWPLFLGKVSLFMLFGLAWAVAAFSLCGWALKAQVSPFLLLLAAPLYIAVFVLVSRAVGLAALPRNIDERLAKLLPFLPHPGR